MTYIRKQNQIKLISNRFSSLSNQFKFKSLINSNLIFNFFIFLSLLLALNLICTILLSDLFVIQEFISILLIKSMKQPWNRFGQNTSIAPSKSSKTIRSKFIVNAEQQTAPPPIYFKEDPMRQQIILRARKQTNRISPQPTTDERFGKVSKIVSDLQKKRDQAKKRLDNLKEQANQQMAKLCPFTPEKKKIPKYVVSGDVIRRNEVWMQQKTKKHLHLKEQRTLEQLRQCTFSPNFEAKKRSEIYLKNKTQKSLTPKKSQTNYQPATKMNSIYSPARSRKNDITLQEFQTAKKYLVSKIMGSRMV